MILATLSGFVVVLSSSWADPTHVYEKHGFCYKKDDWWSLFSAIGTYVTSGQFPVFFRPNSGQLPIKLISNLFSRMLIIQGCLLFLFWYPIMTALATGHSSLTAYVRRCAILTGVTAVSDCTTLGFMIIFIDKAPIPLLATVYVSPNTL